MTAYILECFPYDPSISATRLVAYASGLPDDAYLGRTQPYSLRLQSDFTMETSVFDGNVPGSTSMSLGNISLNNADGALDFLLGLAWGGAQVTLKAGPDRGLYSDFVSVYTGSALDITANARAVTIILRDAGWKLIEPLQKNKYTGGGYSDGYSDLAGVAKPLCYGLCKNIAPIPVDTVFLYYQVHDGAVSGITGVYDDGIALTFYNNYANKAGLQAVSIPEGSYATCLAEGLIRLGAPAAGVVTADVRGQYYDQVTLAQTVYQILLNKAGLTIGEMDAASFVSLGTDVPYRVSGIYYPNPDVQIDQFLDAMVGMADAFWYISPAGKLTVRKFKFSTPVTSIRAEDIQGLERLSSAKPVYRAIVNYDRNLTVQDSSTVTLSDGDFSYAFANEKVYVTNPSYAATSKMNVFIGETPVNDLSLVTFLKNSDVSWASITQDGTITITDPGGANGATAEIGFQAYYEDKRLLGTLKIEKRTDGAYINLVPNARVLKMKPDASPKTPGQTIEITRSVANVSGPFTWAAVDNLGTAVTLGGSDPVRTVNVNSVQGNKNITHVLVTCTSGAFSNTIKLPVSYIDSSVASGLIAADTYDDGTPKEALKPAQVGANVTALNTSLGIFGQGALATRNNVDLATTDVINKSLQNLDPSAAAALNGAVSAIGGYASDDILARGEKPAHNREWQRAYRSTTPYTTQATALGITTELTALNNARTYLSNYLVGLNPPFDEVNTDTPIDGDQLYSLWTTFLTAEAVLLAKMSEEAAKRASWSGVTGVGRPFDYADVTGSNVAAGITGQGSGATANNLQDLNPTDAANLSTVMSRIIAMSSDDVMSKDEKWSFIESYRQYGTLYNSAATASNNLNTDFGSDPTGTQRNAATSSYTALTNYLNGLTPNWQDLNVDTPVDGANLRTLFQNVSNTVAVLMAANSREGSKRALSDGMIYDQTTGSFLSRSQLITTLGMSAGFTGQGAFATLNSASLGSGLLTGFGTLAGSNTASWGSQVSGRPTELTDGRVGTGLTAGGLLQSGLWGGGPAVVPISTLLGGIQGTQLCLNPEFTLPLSSGIPFLYDNSNGGKVTLTRVADATAPNSSGYVLKISYLGGGTASSNPSPGWGGFTVAITNASVSQPGSYAIGTTIHFRVLAKIPVGRMIQFASNPTGTGSTYNWITSREGTGYWTLYEIEVKIGTTGTFSSTGFFHLDDSGSNSAFDWYVAKCDAIDITSSPRTFMGETLLDETGVARRRADLLTSVGTSAAITGQGAFATLNSAGYGTSLLTGFGTLAPRGDVYFGSAFIKETSGGTNASLANFKTSSGTAAGIAGQGAFATLNSAGYGSSLLTGFGTLASQANLYFGSPYLLETSGGTQATLAAFKTASGTAAGIAGQGPGATASAIDVMNSISTGGMSIIAAPEGGTNGDSGAGGIQTGALKIRLPVSANDSMMKFYVDIYEYNTGAMTTYLIGGYIYSNGGVPTWFRQAAQLIGSSTNAKTVRFGYDGTKMAVWIGETNTQWSYPKVVVRDVQVGFNNYDVSVWKSGWVVSYDTVAAANVTQTVTNPVAGDSIFGVNTYEGWGGAPATLGNFKTSSGTAAGIAGQGAFATLNSAGYGSSLLTGFGGLSPLSNVYFGSSYLLEGAGGAQATLAAFKTASGTAAGIAGQGTLATASAAAWGSQVLGRPLELTDGRVATGLTSGGLLQSGLYAGGPNVVSIKSLTGGISGTQLAPNPEFSLPLSSGSPGLYDNSGGGKTAITRVADDTAPNSSGYILKVSYLGGGNPGSNPTPGFGGFYLSLAPSAVSAPNAYAKGTTIHFRLLAKVPVGRTIEWASNATGSDSTANWVTNNAGTGNWEFYDFQLNVGTVGSFGGTGYFYAFGGSNVAFDWFVARCDAIDVTSTPRTFMGESLLDEYGVARRRVDLLTSSGTAAAIAGQGAFATQSTAAYGTQISGLPAAINPSLLISGQYIRADYMQYPGDVGQGAATWMHMLRPGEIGSNVTETRTSAAITGQGPGATAVAHKVLNNESVNGVTVIRKPVGGSLSNQIPNAPGAIFIRLPMDRYTGVTMIRFYVDIYEYSTGKTQTYVIGGHFATGTWYNMTASLLGSSDAARPVKFGVGVSNATIVIGEYAGTWQYPSVQVRDVQVSYAYIEEAQWDANWAVTLETNASLFNIQAVISNPNPGDAVFGVNAKESWGGSVATLPNFKTSSGTAAGIAGQAPAATDSTIQSGATNDRIPDTRNTNQTPSWYRSNFPMREVTEFKDAYYLGIPGFSGNGYYGSLTTTVDYSDPSGGEVKQMFVSGSAYIGRRWVRTGSSSSWGAWKRLYGELDKPYFGTDLLETDGGAVATLGNFKTSSGTAAAISGQGPGATATGAEVLNYGDVPSPNGYGVGTVAKPQGGSYTNPVAPVTGAIKIRLPQWASDTMIRFYLDLYDYAGGYTTTYIISGYSYGAGIWYNVSASIIGSSQRALPVYFGHDGNKMCIWVGGPADSWRYPSFQIRDVQTSYANWQTALWKEGWIVSVDTAAATNVTQTITNPSPGDAVFGVNTLETPGGAVATVANYRTSSGTAAGIAGQGALATANSLAYGSPLLTGFGTFAALSLINSGNITSYIANQAIGTAVIANAAIGTAQVDVINVSKISAGSLSALSANIGLLRTASSGARTEIESNQIRVYDSAGTMRVRIGVW